MLRVTGLGLRLTVLGKDQAFLSQVGHGREPLQQISEWQQRAQPVSGNTNANEAQGWQGRLLMEML